MLAGLAADACWVMPQLFDDMRSAPDFYFDSISQIGMERWTSGRVALVGDAAWCASPASGQGVSLALVGSFILARQLAASSDPSCPANAYYSVQRSAASGRRLTR